MATLTLDPENAIVSIQRRLELIASAKDYIREVVPRYDGLTAFEQPLKDAGVWDEVSAILEEQA